MTGLVTEEQRALAGTLRQIGPDADTLCDGWDSAHLAAHLVLRERTIAEIGGRVPVGALQQRSAKVIDQYVADHDYADVVAEVEHGPSWRETSVHRPTAWLWSIPALRERVNLIEYVVHHEDARRAQPNWQPRSVSAELAEGVWQALKSAARLALRKVAVGVVLAWPGHGTIRNRAAGEVHTVTVTGDPIELAMFALGRGAVAKVEYAGDPADIAELRSADLST